MEEYEDEKLSSTTQRLVKLCCSFLVFFYWANLFAFLSLFFRIVFPDSGKSDFGYYLQFAAILAIITSVGENLRRRKSSSLFLVITAVLFAVNVFVVWRNWFYH